MVRSPSFKSGKAYREGRARFNRRLNVYLAAMARYDRAGDKQSQADAVPHVRSFRWTAEERLEE